MLKKHGKEAKKRSYFIEPTGFSGELLDLSRLWKSRPLHPILGGAALQRCDNRIVLNAALAAEVAVPALGKTLSPACKAAETGLAPVGDAPSRASTESPDQIF